jgi:UDP-N-acetylglucosamine 2-epimerase (hydrolysing)
MSRKRKIIFVTATRADYGKLKSIILKMQSSEKFETRVFVTGMHNMRLYGKTSDELKKDKIKNLFIYNNQTLKSSMNDIFIKTIQGFSNFATNENPDLVIVHGDRLEALACTISSLLQKVKVAHIEGGEVSGTLDEILRHSISKLAHVHFVTNNKAKKRLTQMGENKKNIFVTGSPDIDIILKKKLPSLEEVKKRYQIKFDNYSIAILHSVVTNTKSLKKEVKIFFDSLIKSNKNYIIIYPNNDLGSDIILKHIMTLRKNKKFKIYPSVRFECFLTLLKNSKFIIGNSSCGIIEAPYYTIPTINIGNRQHNRVEKRDTIFNISFNSNQIIKTIKKLENISFKKDNFFGKGNANDLILKLMLSHKFWKTSIQKNFIDIAGIR